MNRSLAPPGAMSAISTTDIAGACDNTDNRRHGTEVGPPTANMAAMSAIDTTIHQVVV